jgi:hypothetical protein
MISLYAQAIASVVLMTVAAAGAGRWIERLLPRNAAPVHRVALVLAGGLGTLGTLLFVIGQVIFTRVVIGGVLTVAGLLGIAPVKRFAQELVCFWRRSSAPRLAIAAVVFVLLVTAIAGLAEFTGDWNSDTISYHMLGPKVWLRDALIRPVPDNCLTSFPQTAEVLFGALLSIGGSRAPGFSAVLTMAVFLLTVAALSLRAGLGRNGAWWCMAIVAAMPAVYSGGHSAFVDVVYASFLMAAVCTALNSRTVADFTLLGVFCGLAMGTKYTGILAAPAVFLAALLARHGPFEGGRKELLKNLTVAAGVACLIASPFYIRNWVLMGSPIYPPPVALLHFFHPKYLSAETLRGMEKFLWVRGEGLGRGPLAYILLPFNLTYYSSRFHGAGGIGLTPLAFCPFALLLARRNSRAVALIALAWIWTTTWFVQQESRYLIPAYAVFAVIAVLGWRWLLAAAGKLAAALASVVIAVSVFYGCFMIASASRESLHAAMSPSYAQRFRRERIPFLESFEYLNHENGVRRVLILDSSVTPYYLDRDYLKPLGTWGESILPYAGDTVKVLAHVDGLGITHILDVNSEYSPFQVPPGSPKLTLVLDLPRQRVYRVLK